MNKKLRKIDNRVKFGIGCHPNLHISVGDFNSMKDMIKQLEKENEELKKACERIVLETMSWGHVGTESLVKSLKRTAANAINFYEKHDKS